MGVLSTNLLDVTGNYQEGHVLCAYGGQLMQIYYVVEEIMKKYPQGLKNYMEKKIQNDDEDYFLRPNNPRELLLMEHFLPFFMLYLKDMKNESIEILLHPKCQKFLSDKSISPEEVSTLPEEDQITFKNLFMENRVSYAHKKAGKSMDSLYDYISDILCKKVPVENTSVKVE